MGTTIDRVEVARPHGVAGWRHRHSALHLAVTAAADCLKAAGCPAGELDLVVNAGVYRDRNMGEPALAALIQDDIGANPEEPHAGGHGTFSFDIANGACGILTALQIVDGFLRARSIRHAIVVASDADPGHGLSENFPFSAAGAALLCGWSDDDCGLGRMAWVNSAEDGQTFSATVGFADARNVLRFGESAGLDEEFAAAAARAVRRCLEAESAALTDVDLIVAAPPRRGFRAALGGRLGFPVERIAVADDERMHTAALAAAFERCAGRLAAGTRVLFVAAGAGVTAGAALYRQLPGPA